MSESSPYTQEDRDRWKQALLDKGKELSDKLERLLAGKNVKLADISLFKGDEPAETKEKRLRRFFDLVMERMRAVNDERFGYDPERGEFWSVAELDEKPWADLEP